jgi:uncharacterized membrane protein
MAEATVSPERAPREIERVRPGWSNPARVFPLLAVLLTVVALILRLYDIDDESLWYDEGYTLLFSRLGLARVILVGGAHEHPPLFYLLVHGVLALQASYLVPRVIAALAGAASVLALYALGSRLFDRVTGLLAAALLAVSPLHLWYSQDGRAYELAGLFVLLSYLCLFNAISVGDARGLAEPARGSRGSALWNPSGRRWIPYVLVTALALYTDYTVVFALLAQSLVLFRARHEGLVRSLLAAWSAIAIAYLPWVAVLLADATRVAQGYWVPHASWNDVVSTTLELFGLETSCPSGTTCVPHAVPVLQAPAPRSLLTIAAALAVVAVAWYALSRRRLILSVVTLWLAAPFVLLLATEVARPLFLTRYLVAASFPLYLLVGLGLAQLWRSRQARLAAVGLLTLTVGLNCWSVGTTYATHSNPEWKLAMRDFRAFYRPSQAVAYYPGVMRDVVSPYLPPGWKPAKAGAI